MLKPIYIHTYLNVRINEIVVVHGGEIFALVDEDSQAEGLLHFDLLSLRLPIIRLRMHTYIHTNTQNDI